MNTSKKTLHTIILILSLSAGIPVCFLLLYLFVRTEWTFVSLIVACTASYNFLIRTCIGQTVSFIFRRTDGIPADSRWFRTGKLEKQFYRIIRVRKWKKNTITAIPEQFDVQQNSLSGLSKNMVQAEIVHEITVVLVFAPVIAGCFIGYLPFFICTSVFSALFDMQFIIIQRYNRPKLLRLAADYKKYGALDLQENR